MFQRQTYVKREGEEKSPQADTGSFLIPRCSENTQMPETGGEHKQPPKGPLSSWRMHPVPDAKPVLTVSPHQDRQVRIFSRGKGAYPETKASRKTPVGALKVAIWSGTKQANAINRWFTRSKVLFNEMKRPRESSNYRARDCARGR